jgi:long-chain acyl-CoA synthetase
MTFLPPYVSSFDLDKGDNSIMKKVIFMTGATGLIGGHLIHHYLDDKEVTKIYVLARGNNDQVAAKKVFRTLKAFSPHEDNPDSGNKIRIITGDIAEKNLALSDANYNMISNEITHIIHSAANVKFQQSLDSAMLVNYDGTKNVFELARTANAKSGLSKVAYISTAYACGNHQGVFYENDSFKPILFANPYEESKHKADAYVQTLFNELPVTIFRPSIIVGDSQSGITTAFNGLYAPLELICKRLLRFMPGYESTPMDIVPVDYVSKAIVTIMNQGNSSDGKVFHLTTGRNNTIMAGEVVRYAMEFYEKKISDAGACRYLVNFLEATKYHEFQQCLKGAEAMIYKTLESFAPYITIDRIFDNSETVNALKSSGLMVHSFKDYYERIFEFTIEANWGRKLRVAA